MLFLSKAPNEKGNSLIQLPLRIGSNVKGMGWGYERFKLQLPMWTRKGKKYLPIKENP